MKPMHWYWHRAGGHTHVRVFMNGGKCGDLCFRNEEFDFVCAAAKGAWNVVEFFEETREQSQEPWDTR